MKHVSSQFAAWATRVAWNRRALLGVVMANRVIRMREPPIPEQGKIKFTCKISKVSTIHYLLLQFLCTETMSKFMDDLENWCYLLLSLPGTRSRVPPCLRTFQAPFLCCCRVSHLIPQITLSQAVSHKFVCIFLVYSILASKQTKQVSLSRQTYRESKQLQTLKPTFSVVLSERKSRELCTPHCR
jgi:hypothetical protein